MPKLDKKERAQKIARDLVNAVNEMNFDKETFAQEIRRGHRTTQQSVMSAFITLVEQWGDDFETGNFDLRNEDTVKIADDILQKVEYFSTRYI
jgi:hypothetical protein